MYILGLNAYHGDSSACLFKNGELIAASEEERFRRLKHWAGLPIEAIRFCLEEAAVSLEEIDHITVSRDPKAKIGQKLLRVLKGKVALNALTSRVKNSFNIRQIKQEIAIGLGINHEKVKASLQFVEHHRSHIASAFHISPYEDAAILSIDGMGDFTSTMRAIGKGNKIEIIDSISYPHSLGYFYTAFTQYLGFPYYGDEYKVMGLSPYGTPSFKDQLRPIIPLKKNGLFELNPICFRHFKEGVSMSWDGGIPKLENLFSKALEQKFGVARKKGEPLTQFHKDLAASVQAITEETIFFLAKDLYQKTGLKKLCITGGVAQNSVANGKIIENTPFESLFVPPAGHDAGTAIGSALYFYHHQLNKPRLPFKIQPYTGYSNSNEEISNYLDTQEITYQQYKEEELIEKVANHLIEGKVIGWFQGKAEFGPRALGNRSILVDPRRKDAKALLNEKIKKRESFRPFAPSILQEFVPTYFEQIDKVPFMEKVFTVKEEKRAEIPAVTHVNGTGRLQTVSLDSNPRYYKLIKQFYEKTGVPILLNTSFNENEPIVNTPEHALNCFLRTQMDVLVLENNVIER